MTILDHSLQLGKEAKQFFESEVGQFIVNRIDNDLETLRDEIEHNNPYSIFGRRRWKATKLKLEAVRRMNGYLVDLWQEAENVKAIQEHEDYTG